MILPRKSPGTITQRAFAVEFPVKHQKLLHVLGHLFQIPVYLTMKGFLGKLGIYPRINKKKKTTYMVW